MPTSRPDAVLASYYDRHMAIIDGTALVWQQQDAPRRWLDGCREAGVSQDAFFALRDDGALVTAPEAAAPPRVLMSGVTSFASGASGWFAIDGDHVLWHGAADPAAKPSRIADDVIAACIGDGADYFITRDGALHVRGLAHRGQYGDGALRESPGFVITAHDAIAVKAHTGHAIHLRRDGIVLGTGGNRFGPLSTHGLGDMAASWGPIFDGAVAIATGARHSLALRADGSLWAWGEGFAILPGRIHDDVVALAAGDSVTLARTADGALWQWDGGVGPRRLSI